MPEGGLDDIRNIRPLTRQWSFFNDSRVRKVVIYSWVGRYPVARILPAACIPRCNSAGTEIAMVVQGTGITHLSIFTKGIGKKTAQQGGSYTLYLQYFLKA